MRWGDAKRIVVGWGPRDGEFSRSRELASLFVCALLAGAVYLPNLGSSAGNTHPDEAFYLAISSEMDSAGTWLTPTFEGKPAWNKPPLLYWGQRLGYLLFGRSLFGGRVPVALSAILLALLVGHFARRLYGFEAGLLAVCLSAGSLGLMRFGRLAMMDVPLALALTAAAFLVWSAAEDRRPSRLLGAGAAVGLACLLKGPVAVVIAGLAFGSYLAVRARSLLLSRWTWGAVAVSAATALPWFLAAAWAHGSAFLRAFLVGENLSRFGSGWTLASELGLLVGFLVWLLPWTVLAAGNLRRPFDEPGALLALLWIAVTLLVYSLPAHKYPHYGIACLPAGVLLAVRQAPPRWARLATAVLLACGALLALLALRWVSSPVQASVVGGCGVCFGMAAGRVGRGHLVSGAALGTVAGALVIAVVVPLFDRPLVPAQAAAALPKGRTLYALEGYPGMHALTLGAPVRRVWAESDLRAALQSGGVVMSSEAVLVRRFPAAFAESRPVARWTRLRRGMEGGEVLRAWWAGDLATLSEPVVAIEGTGPSTRPGGASGRERFEDIGCAQAPCR